MEKNMEKYLRAVRRRLNMPKALKDRVMMDFASSIEARIEDGQSEEAIWAELGTPKQAAAELNRQMQEYTYKKIRNMRPGQDAIVFKLYVTPSESQPVIDADDGVQAKKIQNVYVYCQHLIRMA